MEPKEALKYFFGFENFRSGQEEIISAIIEGRSVVAILPTGGGKSLCYQIPALISPNFSIVISPLIALMKDQVDALNKQNEIAAFINSSLEFYEIENILQKISAGQIKLLYIAPERLENLQFAKRLNELNPFALFVDEAHCISEWGHSFRPSYRKINDFIKYAGLKKISAFTATATPVVVKDIAEQLALKDPKIFVKGFERENISVSVFQTKKKKEFLLDLISRYSTPAIIYTTSRKNAEEVAQFLQLNKRDAEYYHAGLSNWERKIIQERFISGEYPIIVATNAFGMGIDKSNVRLVVHFNTPSSIENYYQEIGRAGRDGLPSQAVLLHENKDSAINQFFISNSYPDKETIQKLYSAICEYANLKVGEFKESEINLDLDYIAAATGKKFSSALLYASLKYLEDKGYLRMYDQFEKISSVQFAVSPDYLKKKIGEEKDSHKKNMILTLLRDFGGKIFSQKVNFQISSYSRQLELSEEVIDEILISLNAFGILNYEKPIGKDCIKLLQPRIESRFLNLNYKRINEQFLQAQKRYDEMLNFVFTEKCRFKFILNYFGENVENYSCGKCDNCTNKNLSTEGINDYAKEIVLKTLYQFNEGLSESNLVNLLKGVTKAEKLREAASFGTLSNYNKFEISHALNFLLSENLVKKNIYKQNRIILSNRGMEFLTKNNLIDETKPENFEESLELFYLLCNIRAKAASMFNQTKDLICPDEILKRIIVLKPKTKNELLQVEGFNERMFTKLGEEILELINDFETGLKLGNEPMQEKKSLPQNVAETYNLINKNYNLQQIAAKRKLSEPVISMQIETILELVDDVDISALVPDARFERIKKDFEDGKRTLLDLKNSLPQNFSYPEIRIALAKLKKMKLF